MAWRPRYSDAQVREAVEGSRSCAEALRRLGLRPAGGNHASLRKLLRHYGIRTDHFDPYWAARHGPRRRRPLTEILVEGRPYNRGNLKRRLYEAGFKTRQCELCGQGEEWNGRHMSLILDHINGVATDNRLTNLRIVCPNCAATLDTHCGRNARMQRAARSCLRCGSEFVPRRDGHRYCSSRCGVRHNNRSRGPKPANRKVPRPSYTELMADVRSLSMVAVGRKYGVSDNAVRKWIAQYECKQT
jgi:hypothetical protein